MESKSSDNFLFICFAGGMILLLLAFGSGAMKGIPSAANLLQSGPPSGDSVVGDGPLSAQRIDTILANAGSPAQGSGQTFYNDSLTYSVRDDIALAFFHHESTYGLYGAAAATHSIGNIVCTVGYSCIGRFRSYPSWQAGIDDWFRLLSGPAYAGAGLSTVETIIPKYAPASDGNSEQSYIAAVESDVNAWRTAA
jgi:hypothetical protein